MLEIIMLVMGIVVLVRGRLSLSKKKEVRGPIARLVGLIMIAPVPIVLGYAAVTGKGAGDGPFGELFVIELGAVLACFILALILAYANAELKEDQHRVDRRRGPVYDDDYDDRRERHPEDDDYDDRQREEDYHERPRRRDDEYDDRDRRR
jgi:uncharacterized membrane protein